MPPTSLSFSHPTAARQRHVTLGFSRPRTARLVPDSTAVCPVCHRPSPAAAAVGERVRPNPRKRTTVGAALLSTAALVALGVQTVPATALPAAPHPSPLRTGGLP